MEKLKKPLLPLLTGHAYQGCVSREAGCFTRVAQLAEVARCGACQIGQPAQPRQVALSVPSSLNKPAKRVARRQRLTFPFPVRILLFALITVVEGHALIVPNSILIRAQQRTPPAPKVGKGVTEGTAGKTPPRNTPPAPKVGKGIAEAPGETKIRIVTKTETIRVAANEGFLNIVAVPGAQVTLTPARKAPAGKRRAGQSGAAVLKDEIVRDEDGVLNIGGLRPGRYQVTIKHPDYQQVYVEEHEVTQGKQTKISALHKLVSKYGELVLVGTPPGLTILLDGQPPANLRREEPDNLILARVPVGTHALKLSKPNHEDLLLEKLEIKPGEREYVAAKLAPASVTLIVRAQPQARVYLNGAARGSIQPDGTLAVPGLLPGTYKMRVVLDGFETAEKTLALSLENRRLEIKVDLAPVAEAEEATLSASAPQQNWLPSPNDWKFDRRGILVKGPAPVLFKEVNETSRFNQYRDFTLHLDLRFANGKGAAWILRARDHQNYYLFELTTARSASGRKLFNFYLCRDGQLALVNSLDVVDDLDNPQASYHLEIQARGNQFSHKLRVSTDAQPQARPLGVFTDKHNTFSIGGIGFQGVHGLEMLVQDFHVLPTRK
jgi:hypothetical protein